ESIRVRFLYRRRDQLTLQLDVLDLDLRELAGRVGRREVLAEVEEELRQQKLGREAIAPRAVHQSGLAAAGAGEYGVMAPGGADLRAQLRQERRESLIHSIARRSVGRKPLLDRRLTLERDRYALIERQRPSPDLGPGRSRWRGLRPPWRGGRSLSVCRTDELKRSRQRDEHDHCEMRHGAQEYHAVREPPGRRLARARGTAGG